MVDRAPIERTLITSALPYINGIKHLGNLVGSMLPADVYARFLRAHPTLGGDQIVYICATDEHGTPAELAAQKAGQTPADFCAEAYEIQAAAGKAYGLSFDHFGRSSNKANHELTQAFAKHLEENGFIEERSDKQIFSNADGRFLPDRYVEGTCPSCGHVKARGDQCDNCGRLLDPIELINPYSAISGSHDVEVRETKHLYLLQSKLQGQVEKWVDAHDDWPLLTKSIAKKWLDEGLRDRGITRDLAWGVPVAYDGVTRDGFDGKVFYVWFDAPIEYIAATQEWAAATGHDWQKFWRNDAGADQTHYVQFMGKDNVAFHSVLFPSIQIGADPCDEHGSNWKMVDQLKSLNWLNWYGGKFSTSEGRGIFMDQALDILPADYWRWYLMSNAPESDDTSFTLETFAGVINKDLNDVLGNFINRITRFCKSKYGEELPAGGAIGENEENLFAELDTRIAAYTDYLADQEFRKATSELRAIWAAGNEYLQIAAPWSMFKTDPEAAAMPVRIALNLIRVIGVLTAPVMPDASAKMLQIFDDTVQNPFEDENIGHHEFAPTWITGSAKQTLMSMQAGTKFNAPEVLFQKIDEDMITEWRIKFGAPEA